MKRRFLFAAIIMVALSVLILAVAWLARARLAGEIARAYFRQHGIESTLEIGALDLSGASGRFALGPAEAPDIAADHIELRFDPLRWTPRLVEVRLVHPLIRARIGADGKITVGSLQSWIDSLRRQQGKSEFVSDDLVVSLQGLTALLATPAGALALDGDVRLVKNLPVTAALRLRPATLVYDGATANIKSARLDYDQAHATLALQFSGTVKTASLMAQDVTARLEATGLRWQAQDNRISVTAASLHTQFAAAALTAGQTITMPGLDLTARKITLTAANNSVEGSADLSATAQGGINLALPALRAADPALANALVQNGKSLSLSFAGHAERKNNVTSFTLSQPLLARGGKGGVLRASALTLSAAPGGVSGTADITLNGNGLPAVTLGLRDLLWNKDRVSATAAIRARFDFAMLRGADLAGSGKLSWAAGRYAFTPSACARAALKNFRSEAGDLATDITATLCPSGSQPLLQGDASGWNFTGEALDAAANLPLASIKADGIAAHLAFRGQGAPQTGSAVVTAAQIADRAAPLRFNPTNTSGTATLDNGTWTGRFAAASPKGDALGEVSFTHTMASGAGSAHIAAPAIAFAPKKLQPADLSPLLAALRQANGSAAFAGDIQWTHDAITSQGKLSLPGLDFLTPLGQAHAIKSEIALTSLLPPTTAPGQSITIAKIDWTLPLSAVALNFGFDPAKVQVAKADTDIAQGHASLGGITINLADPGRIAGTVQLTGIALDTLIAASNLNSKLKLQGKISGSVPFILSPEGFRIVNGHVTADGPGRLSVDRSLWTQDAVAANAMQDFAYQALENLAFDQLTADLNSIPGGRLQVIFHIKGHSDPPQAQQAEIAITDLINGTAMTKPIKLPSGTPIDLTLDSSLNFDELLKSYTQAWSKSLSPDPQPVGGATP